MGNVKLSLMQMKLLKYASVSLIATVLIAMFYLRHPSPKNTVATVRGRTMTQWLQELTTGSNSTNGTLTIKGINMLDLNIEVPLSYDALNRYNFLKGEDGEFYIILNDDPRSARSAPSEDGSNGETLFYFNEAKLHPGTNDLQLKFIIFNFTNINYSLVATSPIVQVITPNVSSMDTNCLKNGNS